MIEPAEAEIKPAPHTVSYRALRTWPALLLVILILLARFGPRLFEGGPSNYWFVAVFGPLLCSLLLLIWWVAASRATWRERLAGFFGLLGALAAAFFLSDQTVRGPGTNYITLPMGFIAFGLAAAFLKTKPPATRTTLSLLAAFAGFGFSALLRTEGMTGDYAFDVRWRWTQTTEAAVLARKNAAPAPSKSHSTQPAAENSLGEIQWAEYRGPGRASRIPGPSISTNWAANPPRQLWRIPVGPAWSSFAVAGKFLFTQEQRGPLETVACYDTETGAEIWKQQSETRFDEAMGGPGPRATPTLATNALFTTGASGLLLRLNPTTGETVWKQDLTKTPGAALPMWGFASSPLIAGPLVIVHAGDKGVVAFDLATGALKWQAPAGNHSYCSAQLNTVAGEQLVLMLTNDGLHAYDPATGQVRLNYEWKFNGYRALQPQLAAPDIILLPTGIVGTRAIRVTKNNDQLAAEELWTSRNLKPDFSDFVIHAGCAYGNDGGLLACIDLKTGERKWKGGRYGKGQLLLLEKSELLLVVAEDGRVALLRADPAADLELASIKALEGKTWNHPVVVGNRLYLRNSQEAAAYELPLAGASVAQSNP